MQKLIRIYLDSVLLGLVLAIVALCGLVLTDIGGVRDAVLSAPDGHAAMALIIVFCAGLFSSVLFAVTVVRMEVAADRAIERRKREGWGRSPRDLCQRPSDDGSQGRRRRRSDP